MAAEFQLESEYAPAEDQPKAIEQLDTGFRGGKTVPAVAVGRWRASQCRATSFSSDG